MAPPRHTRILVTIYIRSDPWRLYVILAPPRHTRILATIYIRSDPCRHGAHTVRGASTSYKKSSYYLHSVRPLQARSAHGAWRLHMWYLRKILSEKFWQSPAKALPFHTQAQPNPVKAIPSLPQAQTNTILLPKSSSNPLYSRSLDAPPTYSPVRKVAKQTL